MLISSFYNTLNLPTFAIKRLLLLLVLSFMVNAQNIQAQTYCTPVYQWGCGGIAITSFQMGTINHSGNACNSSAYNDFTLTQSTDIMPGYNNIWSVATSYNNHNLAIWIDFNDDGDFNDTNEFVYTTSALGVASDTFVLPSTVPMGTHRMRVRLKFHNPAFSANQSCTQMNEGETHDYTVNILAGSNMTIDSTHAIQPNNSPVSQGFTNREIIGMVVYANGNANPLDSADFFLNTAGSSSASDIDAAKIFYTGNSANFSAVNQFGSTVNNPSGAFSISGKQVLSPGANYFWLAYDISSTATVSNVVDAVYDSVIISGTSYIPPISSPSGSREIIEPMAGTYTIGSNNRDYSSFDSALIDLRLRGISAAVVFEVDPGTYNEQIEITAFEGATSVNTITFNGLDKDSAKIIFTQNSSNDRYTIRLNKAKWVIIENLTIEAHTSGVYGWPIHILNNSSDITIQNNLIITNSTSTSSNFNGIVASASNTSSLSATSITATNLVIQNNEVRGGNAQIALSATSNTQVFNNNLLNAYNYAIVVNSGEFPTISGNIIDVRTVNGTTSSYGIFVNALNTGIEITANKIKNAGRYGISISGAPGTSSDPNLIANNSIGGGFRHNSSYGITLGNSAYTNIFNNSVNVNGSSPMAVYIQTSATNVELINNAFAYSGSGGGYAMAVLNAASIAKIDHNNYYSAGSSLIHYNGSDYLNITDLRAVNTPANNDANSISVDPRYLSSTNLFPLNSALVDAGSSAISINTDIEGNTRGGTPDIGAYEILANNVATIGIANNLWENMCGSLNTSVEITVVNMGAGIQTNIPVTIIISGSVTDTITTSIASIGPLTDTTFVAGSFNSKAGGQITITAYTDLTNDENRNNDTLSSTITIGSASAAPTVTSINSCSPGSFSLTATPPTGENVIWYNDSVGSSILHYGNILTTPYLTDSTTYYAATGTMQSNKFTTDYSGTTDGAGGVLFDVSALTTISIDSFAVNFSWFAQAADSMVSIYYKEGSHKGFETDSAAWTLLGTTYVTSSGPGAATEVNVGQSLVIPAGKTYGIHVHYFGRFGTNGVTYSNSDLIVEPGSGTAFRDPFVGTHYSNATFNGDIYYKTLSCQSELVAVNVNVSEGPDNIRLIPGTTFNGTYDNGGIAGIDQVCSGDTLSYELIPHIGYDNSDLGNTWAINSFSFQTSDGTPATDTSWIIPNVNSNGIFTFVPSVTEGDSVFILEMNVELLATGCDTTIRRYINVLPRPQASFTVADTCLGSITTFTNTTTLNGSGSIDFTWNFGDDNTSQTNTPQHLYDSAGEYTVMLTAESNQGCVDQASVKVNVFELPHAQFTVAGACANDSFAFVNSSTVNSGPVSYEWSFGDNKISQDENPTHFYGLQGIYDVVLTVTNNGCEDTATQNVNVLAAPIAGFSADNFCIGDSTEFTNLTTFPSTSINYTWYFNQTDTTGVAEPRFAFTSAGTYEVALVAELGNSCKDSVVNDVTIYNLPDAGFSTTSLGGGSVQFQPDVTTHVAYNWNFGDGDTSNQVSPTHQFAANTDYTVTLITTGDGGCIDSTSQIVSVTGVGIEENQPELTFSAYPNPYKESVQIEYHLQQNSQVQLSVFDIMGKRVAMLVNENQATGRHIKTFSNSDYNHSPGIYIVELRVNGHTYLKQLVRVK